MRVLGALRQSKTKERAVSIPAQRKAIERWAELNGHEIVKFTEDPSTSGKLSAFNRPELGPYLTDPLYISTWDILVTLKIDRACRSTLNFLDVMKWCHEHGKSYVSLKENIDMSTEQGRQAARDAASRAEWERDMASERVLESRAELEEQGRWPGGRVAYGYRVEEREDGFYVVPDRKATARVARKMAFDAIDGKSNVQIARWLNTEGIPTSTGKTWLVETVRQVLCSPNMAGLLSPGDYAALRVALRSRKQTRGQWTSGEHMLLRVAFCARCSDESNTVPLYGHKKRDRADRYRCLKCSLTTRKDRLEQDVERELSARWGSRPHKVPHVIPGDDRAAEIRVLKLHLDTVRNIPFVDTTELEKQIEKLEQAEHKPDEIRWEPTGKTIVQHWEELDTPAARNEFLRSYNVRVWVTKGSRQPYKQGDCAFIISPTFDAAVRDWRE